jgi:Tol biopolymer transport system component
MADSLLEQNSMLRSAASTLRAGATGSICVVALAAACGGSERERRVIVIDGGGGGHVSRGTPGRDASVDAPSGGAFPGGAGGTSGAGGARDAGDAKDASDASDRGRTPGEPCELSPLNAAGDLELVSLSMNCTASDGDAVFSNLTRDGRYIVFDSDAADLVADDRNGMSDVFWFDRATRRLELISQSYKEPKPVKGNSYQPIASDDGRYVAFTSYTFELTAQTPPAGAWVYLRDREAGTTQRFDANFACAYWLDMTPDATVLVAEGYSNCQESQGPGAHFTTVEYQHATSQTTYLGPDDGSDNQSPSVSADGRFVLWAIRPPGTTGQLTSKLQRYDHQTKALVTLPDAAFNFSSTDLSASGQVAAFCGTGQAYRFDFTTMKSTLLSQSASGELGDGTSDPVSISADGRLIAFASTSTNLVEGDTNDASDIFLYDAKVGSLRRVSLTPDGGQADGASKYPNLSADARHLSFVSKARNLLPAATTGNWQVYVLTLPEP